MRHSTRLSDQPVRMIGAISLHGARCIEVAHPKLLSFQRRCVSGGYEAVAMLPLNEALRGPVSRTPRRAAVTVASIPSPRKSAPPQRGRL
jgi:hypothetical protein